MAKSKSVTATGAVISGSGAISGIIVNSHSSGTLKLEDSLTGGQNMIINTFTFPTGSGVYRFPDIITFENGLYATVGGTLNCQLIING